MKGTPSIRFGDLFVDTVKTHGLAWAHQHYTRRGMTQFEFRVWCRSTLL